jgi:hypothetical protein
MADRSAPEGSPDASLLEGTAQLRAGEVGAAERTFREGLERDPSNAKLLRGLASVSARQGRVTAAVVCLAVIAGLDPTAEELGDDLEHYLDLYLNPAAVWGILLIVGLVGVAALFLSLTGYTGVSMGSPDTIPIWGVFFLVAALIGVCLVVLLLARRRVQRVLDPDIAARYTALGPRVAEAIKAGSIEPQRQLVVLFSLPRYWKARR